MNVYITGSSSINPLTSSSSLPEIPETKGGNRLYCLEPEYKSYIPDSTIRRRMSRVVKMGVAAAVQCLSEYHVTPGAIITSTGLGCLEDSEKFLKTFIQNKEQLLNPTPFIQSTFNTVGAQVAMMLGNMNYNMTYVHRGFSFESALLDAMMMINEREAADVLVGSFEETTDTSFEVMKRLGFWKLNLTENIQLYETPGKGSISGEGSQFFILSSDKQHRRDPRILGVKMIFTSDKEAVKDKLLNFLHENQLEPTDVDWFISGENGDRRDFPYYQEIEHELENSGVVRYKSWLGEYQTVTSVALWLAATLSREGSLPSYLVKKPNHRRLCNKILIYNHFRGKNHTFVLLENDY